MHIVKVGDYLVGQGNPLMLMAGPCVLEGYERSLMFGKKTKAICDELGIPYVLFLYFFIFSNNAFTAAKSSGVSTPIPWKSLSKTLIL